MVLPPPRPSRVKFRVDHPLNLLGFVILLNRLAAIGYPHHWLATVLDNLLSGKIKTTARPPPNSMNVHYAVATITTVPFLMELEYAVAACANQISFPLLSLLPSLTHISVELQGVIDPRDDQRACVVALMFAPRAAFMPVTSPKELQTLRETIINGEPKIALLSALRWDSQKSRIEIFAAPAHWAQMLRDGWYAALVRLDTYRVLMKPVTVKSLTK